MKKMYTVAIILIAVIMMTATPAFAADRWETLGTYNVPSSKTTISANVNKTVKAIKLRIQDSDIYVYSVNISGQTLPVNQTFPAGQSIQQPLNQPTYLNRILCEARDNGSGGKVRVDILVETSNNGGNNGGNTGGNQPSAPSASTLNQATNIKEKSISLSWTRNTDSNFASYQIFRVNGSGTVNHTSKRVATITNKYTTSYTDNNLTPNNTYSYRVYTFNTARLNTPSNQITVRTQTAYVPPTPPNAVRLNTPINVKDTSLTLTWSKNNNSDFANYRIYRSVNGNASTSSQLIKTITNKNKTSYTDNTVQPRTNYAYRVYVYNKRNLSKASNQVSVMTLGSTVVNNPTPQPLYGWDVASTADVPDYRTSVNVQVSKNVGGIRIAAFNSPVTIYRVSYDANGQHQTLNVNRVIYPGQDFIQEFITPVFFGSARVEMADFGRNAYVYAYTKTASNYNGNTGNTGGQYTTLGTLNVARNFRSLPVNVNRNLSSLRLYVQDNQVFINRITANVNGRDQVLAQRLTVNRGSYEVPTSLNGQVVRHLTFEIRTTNSSSARVTVSGMTSNNNGGNYNPGTVTVMQRQVSSAYSAQQQFNGYAKVTDYQEERTAANTLLRQLDSMGLNAGVKRNIRRAISVRNFVVFRVAYNNEYILAWYF